MAEINTARPLLRRVLSFREPLLVIPYLLSFLAAAASAFVRNHSSLLHALSRSLLPSAAKGASYNASPVAGDLRRDGGEDEEEEEEAEAAAEDAALSKEEVEAIMGLIGVAAAGHGEGIASAMGREEVAGMFDADEPSFAEVRSAFKVFDADGDGFIGAADLQAALARLGVREDAAACRAMIDAAGGGRDGRMSLFQFVGFLENGLC
ncbi:hypothetical protein HU200_052041 [Digitaria exilis]|uniref:EF-hand domain-containing protein n=1 Tax=Digitaria exilis TaxID=1010633 RepID=A0A835E6C2_9POAL|nr:hypothetical protein HU200_052041 [Digitaria exilis]